MNFVNKFLDVLLTIAYHFFNCRLNTLPDLLFNTDPLFIIQLIRQPP